MGHIVNLRKDAYDYAEAHQQEVWAEFKADMCNAKPKAWLFNRAKDGKPGNLGFGICRKVIQAHYQHTADKKKAVTDIIEMKNPSTFVEQSGFDK
jgi:hypothetical protein